MGNDGRHDHRPRHLQRQTRLNRHLLLVLLDKHFVSRRQLVAGEHAVLLEQLQVLFVNQRLERFRRRSQIGQTALLRLFNPFSGVVVAVENDPFVIADHFMENRLQSGVEVLLLDVFQSVGDFVHAFCHDCIENHADAGAGLAGAGSAVLELRAGKGKGGRSVAVGTVARQRRQGVDADFHRRCASGRLQRALFNLLDNVGELIAEENGNNRRRGFSSAQSMIVPDTGGCRSH